METLRDVLNKVSTQKSNYSNEIVVEMYIGQAIDKARQLKWGLSVKVIPDSSKCL